MPVRSFKSELADRDLWYDGTISTASIERLMTWIQEGVPPHKLCLTSTKSADIKEVAAYNKLVSPKDRILTHKSVVDEVQIEWTIPVEYKQLDLTDYLLDKLCDHSVKYNYTDDEVAIRAKRVQKELNVYINKGLTEVLKAIIFIINTLERNEIVWGVGRGSSVASYVLYLIGTHDVDSFKYNLNITDFIS